MSQRKRERTPTREELELWSHVTKNDQPLAPRPDLTQWLDGKVAVEPPNGRLKGDARTPVADLDPAAIKVRDALANGVISSGAVSTKNGAARPQVNAGRHGPKPEPFDKRLSRRLARGQIEIDARLDLHGMRQADAHDALHRFLFRSQAAGHRNVLVITGKGRSGSSENSGFSWKPDEAGVLRRAVPLWLREPALSPIVVSFKQSSQPHGGSGALYIVLRRPSRVKGD